MKHLHAGTVVRLTAGQQIVKVTCCLLFISQCLPRGFSISLQHIWVPWFSVVWEGLGLGEVSRVSSEALLQDLFFVFAWPGVMPLHGGVQVPQRVDLPDDIVDIQAGFRHTVALSSAGEVWTWGFHGKGQLGLGSFVPEDGICQPQRVAGLVGETFQNFECFTSLEIPEVGPELMRQALCRHHITASSTKYVHA